MDIEMIINMARLKSVVQVTTIRPKVTNCPRQAQVIGDTFR